MMNIVRQTATRFVPPPPNKQDPIGTLAAAMMKDLATIPPGRALVYHVGHAGTEIGLLEGQRVAAARSVAALTGGHLVAWPDRPAKWEMDRRTWSRAIIRGTKWKS